jgi:hypothetical protein
MTKPQILRFAFFCTPYTTTLSENETALLSPFGRGARGEGLANFCVTSVKILKPQPNNPCINNLF